MSEEKKESDLLYIDHRGELLIWLIIILVIIAICSIANMKIAKQNNDYHIFLPDVDGLIVGSPVRIMGIEVGHVTEIEPMKNEVFVKFIIKNKDMKIPQGTEATVEFSGMAGSKSLELYLPEHGDYVDNYTPILTASAPKRLSDVYGLLKEMFKTVNNIIVTTSVFSKRLSEIDMPIPAGHQQNLKEFLKYADDSIDIQQQRVDNLGRKLNAKQQH